MRTTQQLRRWLAREILGKTIPRKPPMKASVLHIDKPPRDYRYRAWIRSLPCAICGITERIEAAHTGPHGSGL